MTNSFAPMVIVVVAMMIMSGIVMRWLDVTFESRMAKYWLLMFSVFIMAISQRYCNGTLFYTLSGLFCLRCL